MIPNLARRLNGTEHEQRVALLEVAGLWESGPLSRFPMKVQHQGRIVEITREDWRALRKQQARIDSLNAAIGSSGRDRATLGTAGASARLSARKGSGSV